ncbi:MAG: NAD(P)H-hydrate epimerase [Chloroflexi bacterium]|nr:NAD(P)H-hydrate epimerase [Chloroflexota bacterium]
MKVVTADQMREIEARADKIGLTSLVLMENAGLAVAGEIKKYLGQAVGMKLLFLIGPGNNGGDGLVAARHLHDWGAVVTVYLCAKRPSKDRNLELVAEREILVIAGETDNELASLEGTLATANAVVDAIFGTGKMRPLEGIFKDSLQKAAEARKKRADLMVIALDLPSGLNPDNGAVDPACPRADLTITLSSPKVGLYLFPGGEKAGRVVIADIGIPDSLTDDVSVSLITPEWVNGKLPPRPPGANKGTFGKLMVVAGSMNYTGAAYLACQAAYRVGTGLVTLAAAESLVPVLAAKLTETTYEPLPEKKKGTFPPARLGYSARPSRATMPCS